MARSPSPTVPVVTALPADPIDVTVLRAAACPPAGRWAYVQVVERTGSTNADLLVAAGDRAPDRSVLVAEHQDAGRGRHGRTWDARPAEGLTLSVLLRPLEVPRARWGWAPLLAGLALAEAIDALGASVEVAIKWPNDVQMGQERLKVSGILAEQAPAEPPALVVGLGVNVATPRDALPAGATSLVAEGVAAGRTTVAEVLLDRLGVVDQRWRAAGGDVVAAGLAAAYRARCATLGQAVRVTLPGDRELVGTAVDVDADGRLLVRPDTNGQIVAVSAGDVVHLRRGAG